MGRPKASVSSGTTKTPPPNPTSEPISPAITEAAATSRKKSRWDSVSISHAPFAQRKAEQQNQEDDTGNRHIAPIPFQQKGDNRNGHPHHWRGKQHQQTQGNDGLRVTPRQTLRDTGKGVGKCRGSFRMPTRSEPANIEQHDPTQNDGGAEQHAAAQHIA